jgi:hypothetical protein
MRIFHFLEKSRKAEIPSAKLRVADEPRFTSHSTRKFTLVRVPLGVTTGSFAVAAPAPKGPDVNSRRC